MSYNLGHKNGGSLVKGKEVGRELLNHVDRNFTADPSQGWSDGVGLTDNGFMTLDHTNADTGGDFMRIEQAPQGSTFTNSDT